jgi:hypothetical protein
MNAEGIKTAHLALVQIFVQTPGRRFKHRSFGKKGSTSTTPSLIHLPMVYEFFLRNLSEFARASSFFQLEFIIFQNFSALTVPSRYAKVWKSPLTILAGEEKYGSTGCQCSSLFECFSAPARMGRID